MALWLAAAAAGHGAARALHALPRARQSVAQLLFDSIWIARAVPRAFWGKKPQLARQPVDGTARDDGGGGVEGSRLLHDFLPRGAAVDVAASRRGRGHRGSVALVFLSSRDVPAV